MTQITWILIWCPFVRDQDIPHPNSRAQVLFDWGILRLCGLWEPENVPLCEQTPQWEQRSREPFSSFTWCRNTREVWLSFKRQTHRKVSTLRSQTSLASSRTRATICATLVPCRHMLALRRHTLAFYFGTRAIRVRNERTMPRLCGEKIFVALWEFGCKISHQRRPFEKLFVWWLSRTEDIQLLISLYKFVKSSGVWE